MRSGDPRSRCLSQSFDQRRDALTDTDAHGDHGAPRPGAGERIHGRQGEPRARHAEGMAERDGAALRVDVCGTVREPEFAQHRERLGREGLVEFDQVDVAERQTLARQQLAHGRNRTHPHDAGRHARHCHRDDPGQRVEAVPARRSVARHDQGRGAVVDTGGIPGRHGAVLPERGLQPGQALERGVGARVLVPLDRDADAALARHCDRRDLAREEAGVLGRLGPQLRPQRESVLVGPGDAELRGNVLGRLGHGIRAVGGLHGTVDEAPADGGVEQLGPTGKSLGGLALHERRAAHALDAAGDHEVGVAAGDRPGRRGDGVEAGSAEPVHRAARHRDRQPRQQSRHAGDIAVVLAGLIGAAEHDIVDHLPVDRGMTRNQDADRMGREVVGPHVLEGAAVAADGGSREIADIGVAHGRAPVPTARIPLRAGPAA